MPIQRRQFLSNALKAVAAFAILPSAVTYGRTWKPKVKHEVWETTINPDYINAEYEVGLITCCSGINPFETTEVVTKFFRREDGLVVPDGYSFKREAVPIRFSYRPEYDLVPVRVEPFITRHVEMPD